MAGLIVPFSWNSTISSIGLAENAQPAARRLQRHLAGTHVVLGGIERGAGVLHFLERHRLAFEQQALPIVDDQRQVARGPGLVERSHGGDEVVLRLHHVGGFDREQRLADRHGVTGLDEQLGDAAGIGGEDRRRAVLVDRDLAFGHALAAEHALLRLLDRQRRPLGGGGMEQAARGLDRRRRVATIDGRARRRMRLGRPDDRGAGDHEKHNDECLQTSRQRTHPKPGAMGMGGHFCS